MIIVDNTKELQEEYDLASIPDYEEIMVRGGLASKDKYNSERYARRVTYNARDLKQIISQMEEIESSIPSEWNEWQRAKYIYEKLGERISYNLNQAEYGNQQSSNLTILLSQKAICAGYSLLYKEMMDRQGIECDYMRGKATVSSTGKTEKHAWNVLRIGGYNVPVDLTWDAPRIAKDMPLEYFGDCRGNFQSEHVQDPDEINYNLSRFTSESINGIDTNLPTPNKEEIIEKAVLETFNKFANLSNKESAFEQVKSAIMTYVTKGGADRFTRDNYARQDLVENVTKDDLLEIIAKKYVQKIATRRNGNKQGQDYIESAVEETFLKYGEENAQGAILKYIRRNDVMGFTRTNGAREHMQYHVGIEQLIDSLSQNMVQDILESRGIMTGTKQYFYACEFAETEQPSKGMMSKVVSWIKQRGNEQSKASDNSKSIENKSKEER